MAIVVGAGRVAVTNESLPAISMLIPAHNEAAVIEAKIANFFAIDYPPELLELIIAAMVVPMRRFNSFNVICATEFSS